MERFDVIRDYCTVNGLTQINNSWTQTAGQSLGVTPQAGDDYEQRVFVAILTAAGGSTNRIESPDGNSYVEASNSSVNVITNGDLQLSSPSGQTLISTASSQILMDATSFEISNTVGNVSIISDSNVEIKNLSGDGYVRVTGLGEIVMDTQEGIDINSGAGITIDSQGDLVYTGNSAVSFNSLGSIAFTSEGGLVFTDTTTNFVQFVMTLPTTDIGLATGQLYTQTATELGGSGTTKVLCIK